MKKILALFLITILMIGAVPVLAFASARRAPEAVFYAAEAGETRGTDSSEKEITAVRLLDSNKAVIAEGTLDGVTWTIVLPPDTDKGLVNRIGSAPDVYMQIEYNGVSLLQEEGYNDAGQESWASGNIICGVSVNSWEIFDVYAEDGSFKLYMIAIEYTEPQASDPETPDPSDPGDDPTSSEGQYHISISAPPGGTIVTNVTTANEGDSIFVSVTPNNGYRMVEGSLSYTLNVAGGSTVKITGNRFQMPNCDVTVSCQWEEASSGDGSGDGGSGSGSALEPGITGFVILGVPGVISKTADTEYAVSVTLPHGTDVTKLVPGIATYGNVTVSPGSGEAQDFSSPVTYTVTLEDGTVLHYVVTVSVSAGSKADQFWDELAETATQDPWWEYAKEQQEKGKYPKYW